METNTNSSKGTKRKRLDSNNENKSIPLRKEQRFSDFPRVYKSSGSKRSLHGNIYQLKLLMLTIRRASNRNYNFRLATEMDDAEKFDDLVFIYEDVRDNKIKYRFLQAKHKQDESIKITSSKLLTENADGDYDIQKYFVSYRRILKNNEIKGECESFTLCTNITFDLDKCQEYNFLLVQNNDALLNTQSKNCGTKCKFDYKTSPIKIKVYESLKCTSDLHLLAKQLRKYSNENKKLTLRNPIFQLYHGVLMRERILVKEENTLNIAKYSKDFLENNTHKAELLRKILIDLEGNESNFIKKSKTIEFKISQNFGTVKEKINTEELLKIEKIDDKFIDQFFEKFIFAVNQPNETELDEIIKNEIREDPMFNLLDVDFVFNSFQKELLDWLKRKEGKYLWNKDATWKFQGINAKINSIIVIGLTLSFRKELNSYSIKFKNFMKDIKKFLKSSNNQILNIVTENVFLSCLKLNELLKRQNISDLNKRDSFIFVNLDTAFKLQRYILNAFKSEKSHNVLIISCDFAKKYDNFEKFLIHFLNVTLKNDKKKIIILTTNPMINLFKSFNIFSVYEKYKFDDFTEDTIQLLENKLIYYQGYEIKIGRITDNLKYILDNDTLVKLIIDDKITIGKELEGFKNIGECNIKRTYSLFDEFHWNVLNELPNSVIVLSNVNNENLEVLNGKTISFHAALENDFRDRKLIVINDNEVEKKIKNITQTFAGHEIYWFKCDLNKLILHKFQASISKFPYLTKREDKCFTENDMLNMKGVVLLSNTAGMGKSTHTIRLTNKLKHVNPNMWIVRVNLSECTDALEEELFRNNPSFTADNTESAIQFLMNNVMSSTQQNKLRTLFEKRLFMRLFSEDNKLGIIFDAFDEISPDYQEIILRLIKCLLKTKISIIWITTRPISAKVLQEEFKTISYHLKTLTSEEQISFIRKNWINRVKELNYFVNHEKVTNIVKSLMVYVTDSINDKDRVFTGIPLVLKMIVDKYFNEFLLCYNEFEDQWKFNEKFKISNLFENFVRYKFEIYMKDKKHEKSSNLSVKSDNKDLYNSYLKKHKFAAFYAMLGESGLLRSLTEKQKNEMIAFISDIKNGIERTGIITQIADGKPQFLHKTLMEYFSALCLIDCLETEWTDKGMLLLKLLKQPEYKMMRFFLLTNKKKEAIKLKASCLKRKKLAVRRGNLSD